MWDSHLWRVLGRVENTMNPKDFEGLYKYKLLIPAFEWASVVCTFVGPVLFPTPWLLFVAAFMVLFFMTSSFQVCTDPISLLLWDFKIISSFSGCQAEMQSPLYASLHVGQQH